MFSEPGAGSDLAALSTRAVRTDGGWLLTGQKVWTSLAHFADWGICLARTDPDAAKHDGIGCFLVDMTSDGLDVRPLRELTGAEMFNEVFLDRRVRPRRVRRRQSDRRLAGGPHDPRQRAGVDGVRVVDGPRCRVAVGPGSEGRRVRRPPHRGDPRCGRRHRADARVARYPHDAASPDGCRARARCQRSQVARCRARPAGAGGRPRAARPCGRIR